MKTINNMMIRLLLLAGAAVMAFASPVTYEINAAIPVLNQGSMGFLEFQFNPGGGAVIEDATATVMLLNQGGSVLGADIPPIQFATGSLPGDVVLNNSGSALYTKEITFGTALRFRVTLDGMLLNSPGGDAGTDFVFNLYDGNFAPLFTGSNTSIAIDTLGNTTPTNGSGLVDAAAVPEPATILLMTAGLVAMLVFKRR